MVMGGDSRSEGRGFESQCRILDGHLKNKIKNILVIFSGLDEQTSVVADIARDNGGSDFQFAKKVQYYFDVGLWWW